MSGSWHIADVVARDNVHKGKLDSPYTHPKKRSRWTPGYCTLCREAFQMITKDHAAKHGFKSPDDMAKSDIVRPLYLRGKGKKDE